MFTGIIQAVGRIVSIDKVGGDRRLTVSGGTLDMSHVTLGDSIAVNGVCLTAIECDAAGFMADVSAETLGLTTLGDLEPEAAVNLETSLTLATPLGGHLVSGHVDGVGTVLVRQADARSTRFEFAVPSDLARFIARKGSIAVDGTSLTVNEVADSTFGVNIVPHTLQQTIMGSYAPNSRVNLEVDLIARYVERLAAAAN